MSKEQFMKEYDSMQKRIDQRNKEIEKQGQLEVMRLVNEFERKNYQKRYGIDHQTVFGALFGAPQAEREIVKNGLNKKAK